MESTKMQNTDSKVNVITKPTTSIIDYCVNCIICNDPVKLTPNEIMQIDIGRPVVKVCDKCKEAVMKMRIMED